MGGASRGTPAWPDTAWQWAENELLVGKSVVHWIGFGIGGRIPSRLATLRHVTLAGYTLTEVPADFPTPKGGNFANKKYAGNVGSGLLRRFHLVFDYPHGLLHVEPGPDMKLPFARNRAGVVASVVNAKVQVLYVAPASPAAVAGWQAGEVVAAIDGVEAPAGELLQILRRAVEQAPGTRVKLRAGDGQVRPVILRELY